MTRPSSAAISKLAWIASDWVASHSVQICGSDANLEAVQFRQDGKVIDTAMWKISQTKESHRHTPADWAIHVANKPDLVSGPNCIPERTVWRIDGQIWIVLKPAICLPFPHSVFDPQIVERLALSHLAEAARVTRWSKGQRSLKEVKEIGTFVCDEMGSKRRLRPHEVGYVKLHTHDICPMRHVPLSFSLDLKGLKATCAGVSLALSKS